LCFGTDGKNYLSDLWQYNSDKDYWTQEAACPGTGRIYATGFGVGSDGIIGSGQDININYLGDFWRYSSTNNTWAKTDSMAVNNGRSGALSFALNGLGYMGTGFNGDYLKDFYAFDPNGGTNGKWTVLPGYPGHKRSHGLAFIIDNKAYILTGIDNGTLVTDMWRFDPTDQSWAGKTATDLRDISTTTNVGYKIIRTNGVAFSSGGKGYVALGNLSSSILNDVWEYTPGTDEWHQKVSFEGSSRTDAVSFSINDRIFVTTGRNGSYQLSDTWEFAPNAAYDPNN